MKVRDDRSVPGRMILGLLIIGVACSVDCAVGTGKSGSGLVGMALAAGETPQTVLAAQIRLQGFACDRALSATRDRKRSRPDYAVWVLRCSNATYRVGRAADMAAKVERLE